MLLAKLCRNALAACAVLAGAAQAQSTYQPPIPADDSLYQAFGGQAGLTRLMDDFVSRLLADPRMEPFFKDSELKELKQGLVAQFCEVAGGPCRREGKSMAKVHEAQDITRRDFNALVEVLQQAMDAQGIAFAAQNRMLALLAPMHREIVNKH